MKYLAVLAIAGGIYLYITYLPKHPVPIIPPELTSSGGTDFLKEPIDRTHEVMKQAKTRADDPALQ